MCPCVYIYMHVYMYGILKPPICFEKHIQGPGKIIESIFSSQGEQCDIFNTCYTAMQLLLLYYLCQLPRVPSRQMPAQVLTIHFYLELFQV